MTMNESFIPCAQVDFLSAQQGLATQRKCKPMTTVPCQIASHGELKLMYGGEGKIGQRIVGIPASEPLCFKELLHE